MAKGRRTINRIQERAPAESDEVEDRDESAESDEGDSDDGDEKVAKPKKAVKKKAPAVKRTRTPKVVRMRAGLAGARQRQQARADLRIQSEGGSRGFDRREE